MSRIRVLVGTRKGAFILTADGKRERWEVDGPLFAGWEVFHMKGSPANPEMIAAMMRISIQTALLRIRVGQHTVSYDALFFAQRQDHVGAGLFSDFFKEFTVTRR